MATCPECEFDEIDTADYEEGDTFSCPECGKNLVLVGADDVEFADGEDEDEDLDEDEDDEDEDDLDDDDDDEDEDDLDDEDSLDEEEDFDE
jgi:ribonuclease E